MFNFDPYPVEPLVKEGRTPPLERQPRESPDRRRGVQPDPEKLRQIVRQIIRKRWVRAKNAVQLCLYLPRRLWSRNLWGGGVSTGGRGECVETSGPVSGRPLFEGKTSERLFEQRLNICLIRRLAQPLLIGPDGGPTGPDQKVVYPCGLDIISFPCFVG